MFIEINYIYHFKHIFIFIVKGVIIIQSRKEEFIFGFKNAIPVTLGYIPMGIGYAALAIKAGLTPLQTVAFSILVYAGAGEIIAVSMLLNGATALAIILTNFVVNLRYFVMNVCVYNKVEKSNLLINALSSHLTTDESFALFSLMDESSIWVYVGLALTSWLSWVFGAAIGVFVLDLLPVIVTNSFNISLYALFVAILIPSMKENHKIALLVVLTGLINILLQFIIGSWSIIVSTLLGALIGVYIVDDDYILGDNREESV